MWSHALAHDYPHTLTITAFPSAVFVPATSILQHHAQAWLHLGKSWNAMGTWMRSWANGLVWKTCLMLLYYSHGFQWPRVLQDLPFFSSSPYSSHMFQFLQEIRQSSCIQTCGTTQPWAISRTITFWTKWVQTACLLLWLCNARLCQNLKAQIGEQGKLRSSRQTSKCLPALVMPHGHC